MVLVQKWHFSNFFVSHYRPGKCLLRIFFWRYIPGKCLLGYPFSRLWNKKFKKSKNWHFSKGVNPWFFSKNDHFYKFFFLGNIGQEKFFYDILDWKNAFLGFKNKKFKKSKNWHFSKVVNLWYRSKNGIFLTFLLVIIGQENVFYELFFGDIFQENVF